MIVPAKFVRALPPVVGACFKNWAQYMYDSVPFQLADSPIHSTAHTERVLLHALLIGGSEAGEDERTLTILAHAAVFHDTRREAEGKDTGHGARAASFYEEFCKTHPEVAYMPEAAYLMRYHDRRDDLGEAAIAAAFPDSAKQVIQLFRIFKDADALDRWRLGRRGLNPDYLRTDKATHLVDFAKKLVMLTSIP
ncbi:MAG: hypothetical protein E7031_09975 [Akkermansiaceae bacterium]|nr:hypothetical protein [Akkermansiaceae bacterium]